MSGTARLVGAALIALAVVLSSSAVAAQGRSVERGRQLFTEHGCHGCHTVGKMGTPIAPDLSRIGLRYGQPQLEAWLRDPSAERPTAHMPRIRLTATEVTALAAYLASLR
jgi:cytochrome c oxidase subunit II